MPFLAILFVVLSWAPLGCGNGTADAANINSMGFNPWNPHCRAARYHRSYAYGRLWFGVGVLGWSAKGGGKLPALVTASPGGTPLSDAGALGFPTTDLLLGGSKVFDEMRIGGRLRGGWWFDLEHAVGIEGSYFGVEKIDTTIDPTQAQSRPRLPFATTDFWAQGLQGSLVCQF